MQRVAGYYVINGLGHANKLNIYIHVSLNTDLETGQCFCIFRSRWYVEYITRHVQNSSKIRLTTYMWAADEKLRIGALWKEI